MRIKPIVLVMWLIATCVCSNCSAQNLWHALQLLNTEHNVCYTVEYIKETGSNPQEFMKQSFELSRVKGASKDEIISFLENNASIPLVVLPNKETPDLYHIIQKELMSQNDYVLNKIVTNYTYEGSPSGLVLDLKSKGYTVDIFTGGIGYKPPNDIYTPIKVDKQNTEIRNLLGKGIDLDEYQSPVFLAYTHPANMVTYVSFSGKKDYKPQPQVRVDLSVPETLEKAESPPIERPEDQNLWEETPTPTPLVWPTFTPLPF